MSKAILSASNILKAAKNYGWNVEVRGLILTITKNISGNGEFVIADSEYGSILAHLPITRPGSTWGTDGGGVGALAAMSSGVFKMNCSGGSMPVLKALDKLIQAERYS